MSKYLSSSRSKHKAAVIEDVLVRDDGTLQTVSGRYSSSCICLMPHQSLFDLDHSFIIPLRVMSLVNKLQEEISVSVWLKPIATTDPEVSRRRFRSAVLEATFIIIFLNASFIARRSVHGFLGGSCAIQGPGCMGFAGSHSRLQQGQLTSVPIQTIPPPLLLDINSLLFTGICSFERLQHNPESHLAAH
jgi:hypothetical protein